MKLTIVTTGMIWIGLVSASVATVPLPDLVFYGKVFDAGGNPITHEAQAPATIDISARLNGAGLLSEPIAVSTELFATNNPNSRDLYVLRIRREAGTATERTLENSVIGNDVVHIFLNGVEVGETKLGTIRASSNPTDVRELNLNDPDPGGGDDNPLTLWLASYGLENASILSDDDGDGSNLFLEWVHGLDPTKPDRSPVIAKVDLAEGNRNLVLTYRRRAGIEGLTSAYELSRSLADWTPDAGNVVPVGIVSNGDGTETVSVRLTVTGEEHYLRVRFHFQP
ncbi:MAG: hypothetical protein R3F19_17725 [Verrucomicrobiales bacterium]